ncbi:MAG: GDP-fucose synthetase [Rhodospirillaceae bacterium]|nr:GDP-fucose synthetase [Rhodospirillaceae bacterium]
MPYSLAGKTVWVAGETGMVGSATVRRLDSEDCEILSATRKDFDLRDQAAVNTWMAKNKPEVVVVAAATVGGILANSIRPAEFLYDNLLIESNIIQAAHEAGTEKLLFLGSACIYPREAEQPMAEDALLTGPLEPTNEWYAVAKIAGIKLCEAYRKQYGADFISAQPNNLYGPGDNFDLHSSHVIPALMVKAHQAKKSGADSMEIWGTGSPMREFLHVDDLADALIHLLKTYSGLSHVNIGTGEEISIKDLAHTIARSVGFEGELEFDTSKPDGSPRKLLDASMMLELGWTSSITLEDGLKSSYQWYLENVA